MATTANGIGRGSFQTQLYPAGLDLNRSDINRALGVWKAASGATFRAGSPVMLNSSGEVVLSDGTAILGIAKWDKMTLGKSVIVDEVVNFGTSDATVTLKHPNISNVQVRSATGFGGTLYTITTDYTLNTTNGTITHVESGGNIDETEPVYVTYTWDLVAADYDFQGRNFWNQLDYVTVQDGRIAVIQPPGQIFTTEYDTDQAYALTGANSNIYVNSAGQFTSVVGSNKLVGYVIHVPSAGDPFLGFEFKGTVTANT